MSANFKLRGTEQPFDFGFEEEDSIEGMKRLIVEEVHAFRAEVRAQARAAGQIRRQERYVSPSPCPSSLSA